MTRAVPHSPKSTVAPDGVDSRQRDDEDQHSANHQTVHLYTRNNDFRCWRWHVFLRQTTLGKDRMLLFTARRYMLTSCKSVRQSDTSRSLRKRLNVRSHKQCQTQVGSIKIGDFRPISRFISETVQDRWIL